MKEKNLGKLFEATFCIIYLIYILIATITFFIHSGISRIFLLYGFLSLTLGFGDSFHLIPRIVIALKGNSSKIQWYSGLGLMISSITMTIFYIILYYIWKDLFETIPISSLFPILIWTSALLRIGLCLFPQNNWFKPQGNLKWTIYRNSPFIITGLCDLILFAMVRNTPFWFMWFIAPAIFFSFVCYLPVVLWGKTNPKVGMLMIPKTIAYMCMIGLGLALIGRIR